MDTISETRAAVLHDPLKYRRRKVIYKLSAILAIGLAYAAFVRAAGFGIPCPIHLITGLSCPGCGITRMFSALLRLNFRGAWEANAAILCLLPLMAYAAVRTIRVYVRTGHTHVKDVEAVNWFMIVVLLIFGIVRNIV